MSPCGDNFYNAAEGRHLSALFRRRPSGEGFKRCELRTIFYETFSVSGNMEASTSLSKPSDQAQNGGDEKEKRHKQQASSSLLLRIRRDRRPYSLPQKCPSLSFLFYRKEAPRPRRKSVFRELPPPRRFRRTPRLLRPAPWRTSL